MTEDIIARIDEELGCQFCAKALKPNGPSRDFCSEPCQMAWHTKRTVQLQDSRVGDTFERSPDSGWGHGFRADRLYVDEIATWYGVPPAMLEPRRSPEPGVAASTAEDLEITITTAEDLEITITPDTSALERALEQASWLSRCFRRHR